MIEFAETGYLEVWRDAALVSKHRQEREAIESVLRHAATVGATATASLDAFTIDGGGMLPPYVLIGSAVAGVVASGALAQTLAITGPRDSQDFVSRIAPDGALRAA